MLKVMPNISFPPVPKEFDPEWCRTIHEIINELNSNNHFDITTVRPPVGAVVAWHKSITAKMLDLPVGWVECNGQTLSDSNSLLDGIVIPNLNGAAAGADLNNGDNLGKTGKVYLSGDESSGVTEFDKSKEHVHFNGVGDNNGNCFIYASTTTDIPGNATDKLDKSGVPERQGKTSGQKTASGYTAPVVSDYNNPRNMTVVWVMRVK